MRGGFCADAIHTRCVLLFTNNILVKGVFHESVCRAEIPETARVGFVFRKEHARFSAVRTYADGEKKIPKRFVRSDEEVSFSLANLRLN